MKGLIKLFLVLLVIVSLLQMFYMLPTRKVEKSAEQYAEQYAASNPGADAYEAKREARIKYLDSISTEEIFSLPLIGSFTYNELKQRQLALGLDLKGGMSAVLRVDLKEMLTTLSRNSKDPSFLAALDAAEKAQTSSQSDFISLFGQEYAKQPDRKKLAYIFRRDASLQDLINTETSDGEVIRTLRTKADETVNLTFKMLKERINKMGVVQPNVSLDDTRDLILVEMPGIENPERAREFLQASAALEFWDTYRNTDNNMLSKFIEADRRLGSESGAEVATPTIQYDTIWTPAIDSLGNLTGDSTSQVVERPMDPLQNQGPLLSMLTLNDGRGEFIGGGTTMGFADKNKRDAIVELLERPDIKSLFPIDSKFLWGRVPYQDFNSKEMTDKFELYLIKKMPGSEKAVLEGDVIVDASHAPDPVTGQMAVNLRMNNKGAQKWAEMTTKAANDGNREVAICIDNEVISAPRVNGPIPGGNTQITGNFSVQEAADFASLLEIGKLPAQIDIVQENTVGPTLGKKNISSSIKSLLVGFGLILFFMVFYYSGAGIFSLLALLLNMFFIFGALASFGTVLTLPGIAGIVLTIGMAVDANVIIYERIREELRAGKSLLASINDGFRHSYSAIIDANVTTLLVAFVLAYFGMGPIKGFAVVLIIGVLSSLFTAVLIGRMLIDWWTKGGTDRKLGFWTGMSKNAFANLKIDWLGKRKIAYGLSLFIILAGLISMFTRGFDLGVDFKGGYSYNVEFPEGTDLELETLRTGLTDYFGSAPVVKAVSTQNTYNIVTDYLINDTEDDAADRVVAKLHEAISAITGSTVPLAKFKTTGSEGNIHITSSSKVGPTIADDIKKSSFYAGIFALLLIFLYIFLRFSKWQYSLGAVAALFHDTLVVLSLFSILHGIVPFSLEIDQAFIAAILTVIGYSINDTVVLFDRIREFLGIYPKKDTDAILNMAINSTFSRTIITSITTLIMITPLFLFGGGSIKGFAFALIIGIVVGTYSSIFVATPIVRDLSSDLKPKKIESKKSFSKAAKAAR